MEAASTVQVVTVSDWPAIVTGLVTGVVGLAGILATYWQGKRATGAASENLRTSINAENERAMLAEKRRIYARFLASLTDVLVTATKIEDRGKQASTEEHKAMTDDLARSLAPMLSALTEVGLVGPESLRDLADGVANKVTRAADDLGNSDFVFRPLLDQLYGAMRADLGEPVGSADTVTPTSPAEPAPG